MGGFLRMARNVLLRSGDDLSGIATLRLDPAGVTAGSMVDVRLSERPRPGTPPRPPVRAENRAVLKLEKPVLTFRNGRLRGAATLSVPTPYPDGFATPLAVDVSLIGTGIRISQQPLVLRFGAEGRSVSAGMQARVGLPEVHLQGQARTLHILTTDWTLKLHYDKQRLAQAISQAMIGRGDWARVLDLAAELQHPGIDLSALTRVSLPVLGQVPVSSLSFAAPTRRRLDRPLMGSAFPFPYRYAMGGVVPTPPGSLFDVWALGLGYSRAAFGAERGSSFNLAFLPTLSVDGRSLVEILPVYAYLEYYRVRRVAEDLEVGFRFTLAPSSVEVAKLMGSAPGDDPDVLEFLRSAQELERKARAKSIASFEVVGRHNWLGGR